MCADTYPLHCSSASSSEQLRMDLAERDRRIEAILQVRVCVCVCSLVCAHMRAWCFQVGKNDNNRRWLGWLVDLESLRWGPPPTALHVAVAQEAETLSKKQAAQELAIRTLRTTTKKAEEDAAEAVTAKVQLRPCTPCFHGLYLVFARSVSIASPSSIIDAANTTTSCFVFINGGIIASSPLTLLLLCARLSWRHDCRRPSNEWVSLRVRRQVPRGPRTASRERQRRTWRSSVGINDLGIWWQKWLGLVGAKRVL